MTVKEISLLIKTSEHRRNLKEFYEMLYKVYEKRSVNSNKNKQGGGDHLHEVFKYFRQLGEEKSDENTPMRVNYKGESVREPRILSELGRTFPEVVVDYYAYLLGTKNPKTMKEVVEVYLDFMTKEDLAQVRDRMLQDIGKLERGKYWDVDLKKNEVISKVEEELRTQFREVVDFITAL